MTSACVSGRTANTGGYGILRAVNTLAAKGAEPIGVDLNISLPMEADEALLKQIMEQSEKICAKLKVQLMCVKAEISPVVALPTACVTAVGTAEPSELIQNSSAKPGQEIVLLGTAGLEGALRILEEQEAELSNRFVPAFLYQTKQLAENLYALPWIQRAASVGVTAMRQIGEGGIWAALWELLEEAHLGMEIEMSRIDLYQETIEICEYYRLNPYQMTSTGSILMITENAEEVIRLLRLAGARASKLGITTDTPARVILGQAEKRYLDRPGPDAWLVWQAKRLM